MKGVLLCKFDENKGYVPVKVYPSKIFTEKNKQLFKDIAKNAIGFGSNIEYNQFELSSVHAISRRFTRDVSDARGGIEIYSLVVLFEENNINRSVLKDFSKKLTKNWTDRFQILKEMYNEIVKKEPEILEISNYDVNISTNNTITQNTNKKLRKKKNIKKQVRKSYLFKDELITTETDSLFAIQSNTPRNFLMVGVMLLIMLILGFDYDFISFLIMVNFGILFYSFISNLKKIMRISVGVVSIFMIYMLIGLFLLIFYDFPLLIQPSFPDVLIQPHWSLLSFLSGFLICISLDRGKKIDKISSIIGFIFIGIDIILFLILPIFINW